MLRLGSVMDGVDASGLTAPFMRANGQMAPCTAKADLSTTMETSTRGSGKAIWLMEPVCINTQMVQYTGALSSMTKRMGQVC